MLKEPVSLGFLSFFTGDHDVDGTSLSLDQASLFQYPNNDAKVRVFHEMEHYDATRVS